MTKFILFLLLQLEMSGPIQMGVEDDNGDISNPVILATFDYFFVFDPPLIVITGDKPIQLTYVDEIFNNGFEVLNE